MGAQASCMCFQKHALDCQGRALRVRVGVAGHGRRMRTQG
jgi:hypothetical protein